MGNKQRQSPFDALMKWLDIIFFGKDDHQVPTAILSFMLSIVSFFLLAALLYYARGRPHGVLPDLGVGILALLGSCSGAALTRYFRRSDGVAIFVGSVWFFVGVVVLPKLLMLLR